MHETSLKLNEEHPVLFTTLAHTVLPTGEKPPADFVVSRYADGSCASRYGDMVWNWTPYTPYGRSSQLSFQYWETASTQIPSVRASLVAEAHWIMYLLAWKRQDSTMAYRTLYHYLKAIRALAKYCERQALSMAEVLTDFGRLLDATNSISRAHARQLSGLLTILGKLGKTVVGYTVSGIRARDAVNRMSQNYTKSLKQHPPLPTRIYAHIISTLIEELDAFEEVAERCFLLLQQCVDDPMFGRNESSQYKTKLPSGTERVIRPQISKLLREKKLEDYFDSRGLKLDMNGFCGAFTRLQMVCKLTVHAFSGMRSEEVGQLNRLCIEVSKDRGKNHYVITGKTTKFNGGKGKLTRWVTGHEAWRAIQLASRLAEICNHAAVSRSVLPVLQNDTFPLFLSTAYLGIGGQYPKTSGRLMAASKLDLSNVPRLRNALQIAITEADLKELEHIDPHRAWRSEPAFAIGQAWTLTSHQLRRSLAIYAQRSGLVSLPSLRRQLQHITDEMAQYYARGSSFAEQFIGESKNHFCNEWREAKQISSGLSYILHVLTTDEPLFGAHGLWVEQRVRDEQGTVAVDREATLARFRRGEIAYQETILGGCTSIEPCKIQPIRWLNIECVQDCKNMVGRSSKLARVVAAQTNLVEGLNIDSVEYRAESADLAVLMSVQEKLAGRILSS